MKYLKYADQFGVGFQLYLDGKKNQQYKTNLGGIASLLIYAIALFYFILQMYYWLDYQLLPTSTQTTNIVDSVSYNFTDNQITIKGSQNLNPFNTSAMILVPIVMNQDESSSTTKAGLTNQQTSSAASSSELNQSKTTQINSNASLASQNNQTKNVQNTSTQIQSNSTQNNLTDQQNTKPSAQQKTTIQNTPSFNINQNTGILTFTNLNLTTQNKIIIGFTNCTDEISKVYNYTCADKDSRENFYKQFSQISINIYQQQYDSSKRKVVQYQKIYKITIDPDFPAMQTIQFRSGSTEVSTGLLYSTSSYQDYLYDSTSICQSISQSFMNQALKYVMSYQYSVQTIIFLQLENIQFQSTISYPLLGTVLANVGSIVSVLMMAQIIIKILNQYFLEQYLIDTIIGYYYPEFKNLEINKSFNNKIQIVKDKNGNQFYEPEAIYEIYKKAEETAIQKLSILNIIYELSRIQFVLQSLQQRDKIQQSHEIGIKLPLILINKDSKVQILNNDMDIVELKQNQQNETQFLDQRKQSHPLSIERGNNPEPNNQDQNLIQFIDSDIYLLSIQNEVLPRNYQIDDINKEIPKEKDKSNKEI